jgi:hypothetical protein
MLVMVVEFRNGESAIAMIAAKAYGGPFRSGQPLGKGATIEMRSAFCGL